MSRLGELLAREFARPSISTPPDFNSTMTFGHVRVVVGIRSATKRPSVSRATGAVADRDQLHRPIFFRMQSEQRFFAAELRCPLWVAWGRSPCCRENLPVAIDDGDLQPGSKTGSMPDRHFRGPAGAAHQQFVPDFAEHVDGLSSARSFEAFFLHEPVDLGPPVAGGDGNTLSRGVEFAIEFEGGVSDERGFEMGRSLRFVFIASGDFGARPSIRTRSMASKRCPGMRGPPPPRARGGGGGFFFPLFGGSRYCFQELGRPRPFAFRRLTAEVIFCRTGMRFFGHPYCVPGTSFAPLAQRLMSIAPARPCRLSGTSHRKLTNAAQGGRSCWRSSLIC